MAEVTLTLEEYEALREMAMGAVAPIVDKVVVKPVKRKASAYSKRFGKAFKKVSKDFKKKNGEWKANGFRSAVRAGHKLAKTNRKL
tara:strand:- start:237 stop:494 length:258 start_codon:yes stop_codon:yes gene_type:complete